MIISNPFPFCQAHHHFRHLGNLLLHLLLPAFKLFHPRGLPTYHVELVVSGSFRPCEFPIPLTCSKSNRLRLLGVIFLLCTIFYSLMTMLMQHAMNAWMRAGWKNLVKYSFPNIFQKTTIQLIQKLYYISDSIAFVGTKYLTWAKISQVWSKNSTNI